MVDERKTTILIIEDELIISLNVKHFLESCGYLIITSHSGETAIKEIKDHPEVDLVLMDIDLGKGMNGFETAKIILGERDIPIIFHSSCYKHETISSIEQLTPYGYIIKNSNFMYLANAIKMASKLYSEKLKVMELQQEILMLKEKYNIELLEEHEKRLKIFCQCMSEIAWEWEIPTGRLLWYGDIDNMLGYDPGGFPRTYDAWAGIIHPDDTVRVQRVLVKHLMGIGEYHVEYRVKTKNGKTLHWLDRGKAICNNSSEVYKMIGTCSEITGQN